MPSCAVGVCKQKCRVSGCFRSAVSGVCKSSSSFIIVKLANHANDNYSAMTGVLSDGGRSVERSLFSNRGPGSAGREGRGIILDYFRRG